MTHFLLAFQRFNENNIRAGIGVGLDAFERAVEAVGLPGVSARYDKRLGVSPSAQATFTFSTMSAVGTTFLNGVCPHFFGNS